jgi:hypothetical protein
MVVTAAGHRFSFIRIIDCPDQGECFGAIHLYHILTPSKIPFYGHIFEQKKESFFG